MKSCILILIMMLSIALLSAYSTDEAISYVLDSGKLDYHQGYVYFFSNTILDADLPVESDAYQFIAQSAYIFLLVQKDWVEYSSTSGTSDIKRVEYVACPFGEEYQDYMAIISMSAVRSELSKSDFDSLGEDERFNRILELVENHCQIDNLSMFNEE